MVEQARCHFTLRAEVFVTSKTFSTRPVQDFIPSNELCQAFQDVYAIQRWTDRWVNKLLGLNLELADAQDLLQEAVEGGLIAAFQQVRLAKEREITLLPAHLPVLLQAMARRIPCVQAERKQALTHALYAELLKLLETHQVTVDGAVVRLAGDQLVALVQDYPFDALDAGLGTPAVPASDPNKSHLN